ncbi:MAG: prolipoprotein diacylglyceryl transferase [Planctomycetes bacterium]|nr:prolipoprotein diacylglyceryl transferase [Planctomycetota bacterium]
MQQIIADFGSLHLLGLAIPLKIYAYGLMLVGGFLAAIYIAQWRARRVGEDPEHIARIGLLSLVGGIAGSRAAYVIQHWNTQFATAENPIGAVLNVSSGGLIYYGGVILATLMVLGYLKLKRLPVRRYLDIVAVPLMVGLAFGRTGCTLNGCCFGARCSPDWPLAMRFPMFSKPLLKFDGRANPYSADTVSPSPVYAHQLALAQITPPAPLVNWARHQLEGALVEVNGQFRPRLYLLPPREYHGRLSADQTAVWADPNNRPAARRAFEALAGPDGLLGPRQWQRGLAEPGGFLRGSEHWAEAILYDRDHSGRLTFDEAWAYLQDRRRRFDTDGDGKLSPAERRAANEVLQADQFALAARARSLPVKPAEPLGIANALLLAGLLTGFYRLRTREGQVFALLIILYPITRFVLESIRADNPHHIFAGVFTHNQYTSTALATIGIVMLLVLHRLAPAAGPAGGRRHAAPAAGRKSRKNV